MPQRFRKQYIVNPPAQFKLMFLILISIIIPTLLTFMTLFFLIQSILIDAKLNNETVYTALLFLSHKIYLVLVLGFILVTVLLLSWSSLFLHRIVGPLYRLEKEIEKVIQGEKIKRIRFRKNDSFAGLADKINTLVEKAQAKE